MTDKMQIANTILAQLGGRKFTAMTGAKHLMAIDAGLQFHLPARFAKDGITTVRVLLEPSDTYRVEFGKTARKKGSLGLMVPHHKTVSEHDGIYADGLRRTFEHATGLRTSL